MTAISGKSAIVVGCTGGVGKSITQNLTRLGVSVLGIARDGERLNRLHRTNPGVETQMMDATDQSSVDQLISEKNPDILIIALGVAPHMDPISQHSWESFCIPWETDMKASFALCKSALSNPLKAGSHVILISDGPALGASSLSGGLSPAKNGQLFLAEASQWQSNKESLGIRFVAIAPKRIMPNTAIGKAASIGYAEYLGMSVDAFMSSQEDAQSETDVGPAVASILSEPEYMDSSKYLLTASGITPIQ